MTTKTPTTAPGTQHQFEAFGLSVLKSSHKDIRRLRKQQGIAELHGNKLWKSSLLLMDYLSEYPLVQNQSVLELGCGWGLVGLYCQKHFHAKTTYLDADASVFPFLERHAQLNNLSIAATLDKRFETISDAELEQHQVLIGTDICFWDEMPEILSELMLRAYEQGVSRIVLADPGRVPFRELADWALETFNEAETECEIIYTDWDVPEPHNQWGLVLDIAFND